MKLTVTVYISLAPIMSKISFSVYNQYKNYVQDILLFFLKQVLTVYPGSPQTHDPLALAF
jgi:hypothetical protein